MDITTAAIATLISALTSSVITFVINHHNKVKFLNEQLDSILKISIQYPYLESCHFTNTWNQDYDKNDEKYLRYEMYCTLLFNYLSRVCSFYNYKKEKIESFIAIKDWVRLHKNYWFYPTEPYENVDTYDKKYVELIKNYLS